MNSSSETRHWSISSEKPFSSGVSEEGMVFVSPFPIPDRCRRERHSGMDDRTFQGQVKFRATNPTARGQVLFRISIVFVAVSRRLSSLAFPSIGQHPSWFKSITRSRGFATIGIITSSKVSPPERPGAINWPGIRSLTPEVRAPVLERRRAAPRPVRCCRGGAKRARSRRAR